MSSSTTPAADTRGAEVGNAPPAFRDFIDRMTRLVSVEGRDAAPADASAREAALLEDGTRALRDLVSNDDWLPDAYAQPSPERYQQFLLYCDPQARFSVVSFVWGPGQRTPIHDHTVWGLIGMLRGAEASESYAYSADETLQSTGHEVILQPGSVEAVSPTIGDIHRVANLHDDRVSISIHVYGADIGQVARWVYPEDGGARKRFVSGYSNGALPPLLSAAAQ